MAAFLCSGVAAMPVETTSLPFECPVSLRKHNGFVFALDPRVAEVDKTHFHAVSCNTKVAVTYDSCGLQETNQGLFLFSHYIGPCAHQ